MSTVTKKKKVAKSKVNSGNGEATTTPKKKPADKPSRLKVFAVKGVHKQHLTVTIRGLTPLVTHNWSDKAKRMIRDKKANIKTKERQACDPQQEGEDALYRLKDGRPGIRASSIKKCILKAAHKDIGIVRELAKKAVFVFAADETGCVPISPGEYEIVEDHVRVGKGQADLRYRPFTVEIDGELLTPKALLTLIDRAGFGVGLCEMRPEKEGDYGRFCVDHESPLGFRDLGVIESNYYDQLLPEEARKANG